MGNDNRYDNQIITVKMTKTVNASDDGVTVKERKKGSTHTGKAHFLNCWIANDWAKPLSVSDVEEKENTKADKSGKPKEESETKED